MQLNSTCPLAELESGEKMMIKAFFSTVDRNVWVVSHVDVRQNISLLGSVNEPSL